MSKISINENNNAFLSLKESFSAPSRKTCAKDRVSLSEFISILGSPPSPSISNLDITIRDYNRFAKVDLYQVVRCITFTVSGLDLITLNQPWVMILLF